MQNCSGYHTDAAVNAVSYKWGDNAKFSMSIHDS